MLKISLPHCAQNNLKLLKCFCFSSSFFCLCYFFFLSVNKRSISICTRLVTHLSCISRPVEKVSCETQRKPEKIEIIMEIKYKTNEHLLSVHLRLPRVGESLINCNNFVPHFPFLFAVSFSFTHSLALSLFHSLSVSFFSITCN